MLSLGNSVINTDNGGHKTNTFVCPPHHTASSCLLFPVPVLILSHQRCAEAGLCEGWTELQIQAKQRFLWLIIKLRTKLRHDGAGKRDKGHY
jgi:hypothetical protein